VQLGYCVRLVAVEDEEEDEQQQQQKKPPLQALKDITRLFPWHGRQKQAARRL
jgi:hypothetical protein